MAMKQGTRTITLRVSQELYNEIFNEANKEARSINNFISYVVKTYIDNKQNAQKNKDRE